jgi:CRP/FNR family cyclic AMP-dependent transcriptional regulator
MLTPDQLRSIPLLRGMNDQQLRQLAGVFERQDVPENATLFQVDQPAECFYLLARGEVKIYEGDKERYALKPPAPIGELGALADLKRNTTAVVSRDAELWVVCRETLLRFFESHNEIALTFYQNLVLVIADKVRRDQTRLEDMRRNIIRTQKAMKQMRDYLLESEDTPVSDTLHNKLEDLIGHNRRVNYRVRPPKTLPATVRLDRNVTVPVAEISRTHLSFPLPEGPLPADGAPWSGVLSLSGPEIPISGTVLRTINRRVDLKLDLLIDDYGSILDGYLTRVQMLDFMV